MLGSDFENRRGLCCAHDGMHKARQVPMNAPLPRSAIATLLAVVPLVLVACDDPKPPPSATATASATAEAPKEKPFELPKTDEVKLPMVGDWVDRARSKLPAKEVGKLDAWLKKVVHMPVEIRGESRKALSETGELTCGYDDKMTCTFPGKLSSKAKYFVASTLVCVDRNGTVVHRADWKIPPDVKRDEVVGLPVDDGLMRECWSKDGESLRLELVGSPCVVPFPRQVRCAGEYNTCLHRCDNTESCELRCDVNRRKCLAVCK